MKPLKPATTAKQQLIQLKSRGLIIENSSYAEHYLNNIGYYRLSGYFYPFRQVGTPNAPLDKFIEKSCFNDVIQLYIFDKKLRLLVFDALEIIEMAIRVDITNTLARLCVNAHEFSKYFNQKHTQAHNDWLQKYNQLVTRNKKLPFIAHNLNNYGTLPIWVACEILDFGALSKLYQLLRYKDKQYIASKYKTTPHFLEDWLRSLNFIRNICAHHTRLWNVNIVNRSDINKAFPNLTPLKNHNLCAYLILIQHFLSIIYPRSTWKYRCVELIKSFPYVEHQAINLNDMGYFSDFENILCNWSIK